MRTRIKQLRKANRLTQAEFAQKLNIGYIVNHTDFGVLIALKIIENTDVGVFINIHIIFAPPVFL